MAERFYQYHSIQRSSIRSQQAFLLRRYILQYLVLRSGPFRYQGPLCLKIFRRCSCCGLALRFSVLIPGTCCVPGELVPLGREHILDKICLCVEHVDYVIGYHGYRVQYVDESRLVCSSALLRFRLSVKESL